jgi:hypothetical protein
LAARGERTRKAGTTIATSDRAVIKTPENERPAGLRDIAKQTRRRKSSW